MWGWGHEAGVYVFLQKYRGGQVKLSARKSEGPMDSSRQDYQSQHHL